MANLFSKYFSMSKARYDEIARLMVEQSRDDTPVIESEPHVSLEEAGLEEVHFAPSCESNVPNIVAWWSDREDSRYL